MKFPQLNKKDIKYCAVFYEGQHNDARTNVAIAMTAAEKGANIANYVEMANCIFDDAGKVIGVEAHDRVSGDNFKIYAKNIIFAGGPFTDAMRQKESQEDESVKGAVQGASGSHVVLPGYYAPRQVRPTCMISHSNKTTISNFSSQHMSFSDMGLLDYNTSDGRFLFFLPCKL